MSLSSVTDAVTSSLFDDAETAETAVNLIATLANSTMSDRRRSFVNCSGELYSMARARGDEKRAMETLKHVVFYVVLSLGVPGNILSAVVWLRARVVRHNSSAVYLGALAVDDLVFLGLFFVTRVCLKVVDTRHWPAMFFGVLSNARRAAEMLEPLIVAAFSLERLVAIVRPLQVLSYFSTLSLSVSLCLSLSLSLSEKRSRTNLFIVFCELYVDFSHSFVVVIRNNLRRKFSKHFPSRLVRALSLYLRKLTLNCLFHHPFCYYVMLARGVRHRLFYGLCSFFGTLAVHFISFHFNSFHYKNITIADEILLDDYQHTKLPTYTFAGTCIHCICQATPGA